MDTIHKLFNILLPPLVFFASIVFLPPYLLFKLFMCFIKSLRSSEELKGKVILITGASSGIGEYLAYEYAKKGARLALAARRENKLSSVAVKAIELGSPDAIAICTNVAKVEDCKRMVEETINHFGQLDHLVNNAGIAQVALFEDCTQISSIRSIMEINFWGSVYCTQFAIPHLRKSKGKIVVISSSVVYISPPKFSVYAASKSAQITFFETLKTEIGSDIGVTIVTPGVIESEITGKDFYSKVGMKCVPPAESTERGAKAILSSVCKGDQYLTEPSYYRIGFWLDLCFHELIQKYFKFTVAQTKRLHTKDS